MPIDNFWQFKKKDKILANLLHSNGNFPEGQVGMGLPLTPWLNLKLIEKIEPIMSRYEPC